MTSTPSVPTRRGASAAAGLIAVLARAAWFVENEVRAVSDLVPAGGTCVDVGAGYGLYTAAMSAAVGEGGTVHAVEPQPASNRAIDRVLRFGRGRATVVRHTCVLSDRSGVSTLSVPLRRGRAVHGRAFITQDALHSGPNAVDFAAERALEVQVTTLDELAAAHGITRLDMIKADVEGAELQVLTGGAATIERHRPTVQLEIEERHLDKYGRTVADVTGFLLDRGYSLQGWLRGGWNPVRGVTADSRNYLFVP